MSWHGGRYIVERKAALCYSCVILEIEILVMPLQQGVHEINQQGGKTANEGSKQHCLAESFWIVHITVIDYGLCKWHATEEPTTDSTVR